MATSKPLAPPQSHIKVKPVLRGRGHHPLSTQVYAGDNTAIYTGAEDIIIYLMVCTSSKLCVVRLNRLLELQPLLR